MNAPILISGLSLVFAFVPACEQKAKNSKAPEASSGDKVDRKPVGPVEAFRSALNEGQLERARTALERVPDEQCRGFLRDQLNEAIDRQIRQRASKKPVEALDAISKGKERLEIFWLEVAMSEFLAKDRDAALAWHTAHAESLGAEGNDRIILAIARNSLAAGDWQSAKGMKDKVGNPELQQAIGDGIGAAMEKDIRSRVRDSAEDAMMMLLRGESGFETFWIEVAMNEYMAADPNGAEKWYWANGPTLHSDQHDRVALAYARAANQSGNKEVSSHWANQIKEKELRDVVLNEIGAAN